MISFVNWMQLFGEAWTQKSIRQRIAMMKPAIAAGEHPEIKHRSGKPIEIDYSNPKDAMGDMRKAAYRAEEINRSHPDGVTVYHSIVPNNVTRPLSSILTFLIKNPNPRNEQSVSVSKGIWESGMVVVGKTKKLIAYWGTDVRTKGVVGNQAMKMPTQAKRDLDFRPYDEALVRLGDVKWHTIHYDPNNKFLMDSVGGEENLNQIANNFNLSLKKIGVHADEGGSDDNLVLQRHSVEISMQHLISKNVDLHRMLIRVTTNVEEDSHRYPPEVVDHCSRVRDELENNDPTHTHLRDNASKRLGALKSSYNMLVMFYRQLRQLLGGE